MTDFIKKTLGSDEKLLMYAHLHWIVLFRGIVWLVVTELIGWGVYQYIPHWLSFAIPAVTGVIIFMMYLIRYMTTHIGLTDRRLLMRTGWIAVDVEEVDLDEVKAQKVDHGLLGRFLDYGEIHLDARFVGDIPLPDISKPYRLLRGIHEVCSQLGESAYFPPGPAHIPPANGQMTREELANITQAQYNESALPSTTRPEKHN